MKPFERTLDLLQREVELKGRCHEECVYLTNQSFQVSSINVSKLSKENLELEQLNRLKEVINNLRSENRWMSAVLHGDRMTIQFQESETRINATVSLPEADVYNSLESLVHTVSETLNDLCLVNNENPGTITVNIGYVYARYTDMIYIEENIIDFGD